MAFSTTEHSPTGKVKVVISHIHTIPHNSVMLEPYIRVALLPSSLGNTDLDARPRSVGASSIPVEQGLRVESNSQGKGTALVYTPDMTAISSRCGGSVLLRLEALSEISSARFMAELPISSLLACPGQCAERRVLLSPSSGTSPCAGIVTTVKLRFIPDSMALTSLSSPIPQLPRTRATLRIRVRGTRRLKLRVPVQQPSASSAATAAAATAAAAAGDHRLLCASFAVVGAGAIIPLCTTYQASGADGSGSGGSSSSSGSSGGGRAARKQTTWAAAVERRKKRAGGGKGRGGGDGGGGSARVSVECVWDQEVQLRVRDAETERLRVDVATKSGRFVGGFEIPVYSLLPSGNPGSASGKDKQGGGDSSSGGSGARQWYPLLRLRSAPPAASRRSTAAAAADGGAALPRRVTLHPSQFRFTGELRASFELLQPRPHVGALDAQAQRQEEAWLRRFVTSRHERDAAATAAAATATTAVADGKGMDATARAPIATPSTSFGSSVSAEGKEVQWREHKAEEARKERVVGAADVGVAAEARECGAQGSAPVSGGGGMAGAALAAFGSPFAHAAAAATTAAAAPAPAATRAAAPAPAASLDPSLSSSSPPPVHGVHDVSSAVWAVVTIQRVFRGWVGRMVAEFHAERELDLRRLTPIWEEEARQLRHARGEYSDCDDGSGDSGDDDLSSSSSMDDAEEGQLENGWTGGSTAIAVWRRRMPAALLDDPAAAAAIRIGGVAVDGSRPYLQHAEEEGAAEWKKAQGGEQDGEGEAEGGRPLRAAVAGGGGGRGAPRKQGVW